MRKRELDMVGVCRAALPVLLFRATRHHRAEVTDVSIEEEDDDNDDDYFLCHCQAGMRDRERGRITMIIMTLSPFYFFFFFLLLLQKNTSPLLFLTSY